MIDLIISATVGGFIGFFTCALMTGGRIADEIIERLDAKDEADEARNNEAAANRIALDALDAHARATDRGNTLQARIDRALACETPKAAHGVKKMARILRGDA